MTIVPSRIYSIRSFPVLPFRHRAVVLSLGLLKAVVPFRGICCVITRWLFPTPAVLLSRGFFFRMAVILSLGSHFCQWQSFFLRHYLGSRSCSHCFARELFCSGTVVPSQGRLCSGRQWFFSHSAVPSRVAPSSNRCSSGESRLVVPSCAIVTS